MTAKKRYKQAAILSEIENEVNGMAETERYGFTYAVNLALSRYFNLPVPELPATRISKAVKTVKSEVRAAAGKRGAASKWGK